MANTFGTGTLPTLGAQVLCFALAACNSSRNVGATGPDSRARGGMTSVAGNDSGTVAETSGGAEAASSNGADGNTVIPARDAGMTPPTAPSMGGEGGSPEPAGGSGGVSSSGQGGQTAGSAGTPQGGNVSTADCRQGAACTADDTCRASAGDCFVDCTCSEGGTFDCELDCPAPESCSEGAACEPGTTCGAELNATCWVSCLCRSDGTFRCDEGCGASGPGGALLCDAPPGRVCDPATSGSCGGGGGTCFSSCRCNEVSEQIECSFGCQNEMCPPSPPPAGFTCQPPSVSWYPVGATCPYEDLGVTCTCAPFGTADRVFWECAPTD